MRGCAGGEMQYGHVDALVTWRRFGVLPSTLGRWCQIVDFQHLRRVAELRSLLHTDVDNEQLLPGRVEIGWYVRFATPMGMSYGRAAKKVSRFATPK